MLDLLLRNWLHNAAKQKLYAAAAEAARERLSQPADEANEPARPRPCDVGIVFASGAESGGLEDRLSGTFGTHAGEFSFQQGGLEGRHVVLVQSGASRTAAAKATQLLIAGHQPQWVIAAGFASALAPDLKLFDFVLARNLADTGGHRVEVALQIPPEALAATPHLHTGRLLTVNRPLRPSEKQPLAVEHRAIACDLQSLSVAQTCLQEQTRFLAVHIVLETVDEPVPAELAGMSRPQTAAGRLGALVGAIAHRPSSVKDMLKRKENALLASDRLAELLREMILQLAPRRQDE